MQDLVSVIVPVYNVEQYLSECIASIVNQQYKELEIILIDDGSTDCSGAICDEWAKKDERISVIHKEHEGVSTARNTGIVNSKGKWIGFADADDRLEPEMYQALVERMTVSDADAVMCGYYRHQQSPDGWSNHPIKCGDLVTESAEFEEAFLSLFQHHYFTTVWNKLFRREAIFRKDKTILMDPDLSYGEDEVWLYKVMRNCTKISFVPQALYHHRFRKNSLSRKTELDKEAMSLLDAKKKALEALPSTDSIQEFFRARIYNSVYRLKVISYVTKDRKNSRKIQEYLQAYRKDWLFSKQVSVMRKIKILLLEISMKTKMPNALVIFIYNIHRIRA